MNELTLAIVLGAVLCFFFLVWLILGAPPRTSAAQPVASVEQMLRLQGLAFDKAHLLLDATDYRGLYAKPSLRRAAAQMRHDRKEMLLLWLRLLQQDVWQLWRFRRFLVRLGLRASFFDECRIALAAVRSIVLLAALRLFIQMAGPFFLPALVEGARQRVEATSQLCAALLHRLPEAAWPEVERRWALELASASLR